MAGTKTGWNWGIMHEHRMREEGGSPPPTFSTCLPSSIPLLLFLLFRYHSYFSRLLGRETPDISDSLQTRPAFVQASSQNEFFFLAKFNNNIKNIPLEDHSLHESYKKNETNISCAMIPLPELTRQEGVSYLPIQIYLSMGDAFQLVFKYIKNGYPNSNGAH